MGITYESSNPPDHETLINSITKRALILNAAKPNSSMATGNLPRNVKSHHVKHNIEAEQCVSGKAQRDDVRELPIREIRRAQGDLISDPIKRGLRDRQTLYSRNTITDRQRTWPPIARADFLQRMIKRLLFAKEVLNCQSLMTPEASPYLIVGVFSLATNKEALSRQADKNVN
ncbi:hypothetical protein G5I_00259 [Acromyrmex echinatior]|uniref:Uncharacterized protein n=1 Tax=Acromyrmex echinatior TaxID=103372 RepID=F4W4D9_ACREC|nr:hypothetical protein G5I_00259 [Acromyrmex echinatior]